MSETKDILKDLQSLKDTLSDGPEFQPDLEIDNASATNGQDKSADTELDSPKQESLLELPKNQP